jgi:glycerophosphoryl diester phosphodiesterase
MFENITGPVIFGHRGACALAPENTIASFKLAVEHMADFIELDAKLSADGEVMVIHDQTVDRTTNGSGRVNQLTLAQLKELDAGGKFDKKFSGEKIPTLDEVFKAVGKEIFVNVELTNYASKNDDLVTKVVAIIKANQMESQVLFSSFLPKNLAQVHNLLPEAPVGILCLEGFAGSFSRSFLLKGLSPRFLHPYLKDTTPALVEKEHKRGRKVNVWTVNAEEDLRRLFSIGVDGVFTDDPQKARKILDLGKSGK